MNWGSPFSKNNGFLWVYRFLAKKTCFLRPTMFKVPPPSNWYYYSWKVILKCQRLRFYEQATIFQKISCLAISEYINFKGVSYYFQARGTIYVSIFNFLLWLFAYLTYMRNPESDLPNFYCEFIMVLGFFGLLVIFVGYGLMSKRFRNGLRGKNAAMAAKYKVVKGGKISDSNFKLMIWIVSRSD